MNTPRLILKAVTLYGVGPYHDPYRLDIKPLTILCGANGTGKSTWVEIIRKLRNALDEGVFPYSLAEKDSFQWEVDPRDGGSRRNATLRNALISTQEDHDQYYEGFTGGTSLSEAEEEQDRVFGSEPTAPPRNPDFGWFGTVGVEIEAAADFSLPGILATDMGDSSPQTERSYAQECLLNGVIQKGMLFTLRFCLGRNTEDWYGVCDEILAIEFSIDKTHSLFLEDHNGDGYSCHLTHCLVPAPTKRSFRHLVGVLDKVQTKDMRFLCHPSHTANQAVLERLCNNCIALFGEILREVTDGFFYLGPIRTSVLEDENINKVRNRYVGARGQNTMACYTAYAHNEMRILHHGESIPFSPRFDRSQVNPFGCISILTNSKLRRDFQQLDRVFAALDKATVKGLVRRCKKIIKQETLVDPVKESDKPPGRVLSLTELEEVIARMRKWADEWKQTALDQAHGISRPVNEAQALAQDLAEALNEILSKRDLYDPEIWTDDIREERIQILEHSRATLNASRVEYPSVLNERGEKISNKWEEAYTKQLFTLEMLASPANCYTGLPKRAKYLIDKGVQNLDVAEVEMLNRMLVEGALFSLNAVWHHPGFVVETYFGVWLKKLLGVVPFPWGEHHGDRATPLASDWLDLAHPPAGVLSQADSDPEATGYDFQPHLSQPMNIPLTCPFVGSDFSTETNCQGTIRHLSTGFHQLAPIILQGGLTLPGEIVAVQNPEAHLHPELQIGIAEYFINEAKTGKVFVIETHSDLIIRRALRAILQEEISQNHVGIYFTEKNKVAENATSSSLKPIAVDAMGRISNWPKGFMDADIIEARRMMDAMYGALEEDLHGANSEDKDNNDE